MMNNEKLAERDLFESELRKSSAMASYGEEYALLALQRNPAGDYSTVWVQSAWMGWQMASAQPAQPAIAGSIGDDDTFCSAMSSAIVCGQNGSHGLLDKIQAVIDAVDSRPRQAVQQASAVPRLDYDLLKLALNQAKERLRQADEFIARQEGAALAAFAKQASAGELPPLPKDCGMLLPQRTMAYNAGQMRAYARAALAQQAPDTVRDDALEDASRAMRVRGLPSDKISVLEVVKVIEAMKSTAPKLADGDHDDGERNQVARIQKISECAGEYENMMSLSKPGLSPFVKLSMQSQGAKLADGEGK